MALKKVTRKIISSKLKKEVSKPQQAVTAETNIRTSKSRKFCSFCQNKSQPSYTDIATLRRFLTDRAKILGKERSGICSKHQRVLSRNIKYARHLALLPFVPQV